MTINYQLQRAAVAGRSVLSGSFEIAPAIEQIANSLRKVHAEREIEITTMVVPGAKFQGDRGDMMEMVGNVADNACKWARKRVNVDVSIRPSEKQEARDSLVFEIRDDGHGMEQKNIERAMLKGARLEKTTDGHGIGLAVVKELVEDASKGEICINSSESGTVVQMIFEDY